MNVEICMTDTNYLPTVIRQKLFSWEGTGTQILLTYMKAGIELDLMFDSVKEFIRAVRPVNELLGFIKSVNKEFKKHVKI